MSFYDSLFEISTPLLFVFSIGALVALSAVSAGCALLVLRVWPSKPGATMVATTLTGFLTPAALMIAFISNEVWTVEGKAQTATDREGIAVAEVLRLSDHLPDAQAGTMRRALLEYADSVVRYDWPAMDRDTVSPHTDEAFYKLRNALYVMRQANDATLNPTLEAIQAQLNSIAENKESRRVIAKHRVSGIKWTMMAVLLMVSAYILVELHRPHRREMLLSLGLFCAGFGSICFLILMYDRPFAGVTRIEPVQIEQVLQAEAG